MLTNQYKEEEINYWITYSIRKRQRKQYYGETLHKGKKRKEYPLIKICDDDTRGPTDRDRNRMEG